MTTNTAKDTESGPSADALEARRPGRPRSSRAEEAILDAVFTLFADGATYDGLSMEMIAGAAKVGKATIYRRWPNKEALVIDAISRRLHPPKDLTPPGESVRDDLVWLLELMREHLQNKEQGPAVSVLAEARAGNPVLYRRYHEVAIEPRREEYRKVLRRGIAEGVLRPDLDVERAMVILTGSMLTVTRHVPTPEPVGRDFSVGLVDDLLRGVLAHYPEAEGGCRCAAALTPSPATAT